VLDANWLVVQTGMRGATVTPDIDKIASRPQQYLTEAGIPQLVGGLTFFFLGTSVLVLRLLPTSHVVQWAGVLFAGVVLWTAKSLKQRLVFPRGGYVEPLPNASRAPVMIIALVLGLLISVTARLWRDFVPSLDSPLIFPGFAVAFSALLLFTGWRKKSVLILWLGAYFLCLAPVLWLLPFTNYEKGASLQAAAGAILAIAGAIRLRHFIRVNPIAVVANNE
jgi:hypothetical protein